MRTEAEGRFSLSGFKSIFATKVLFFFLNSFSILRPGLDFYFLGWNYCLRRGKFRIVYPVTVWVSGVSQTAKTEV